MEVNCQLHTPAALSGRSGPHYPLNRGWMSSRVGMDVMTKGNISAPAENETLVAHPIASLCKYIIGMWTELHALWSLVRIFSAFI
jgi:hypothetical protein